MHDGPRSSVPCKHNLSVTWNTTRVCVPINDPPPRLSSMGGLICTREWGPVGAGGDTQSQFYQAASGHLQTLMSMGSIMILHSTYSLSIPQGSSPLALCGGEKRNTSWPPGRNCAECYCGSAVPVQKHGDGADTITDFVFMHLRKDTHSHSKQASLWDWGYTVVSFIGRHCVSWLEKWKWYSMPSVPSLRPAATWPILQTT